MKIVVNADDLGYSAHRDRGIFDCFQKGYISAASLMVNGPTAVAAAGQAVEVGLCMGLHLNLTEGAPVADNVSSLIHADGTMCYKNEFWAMSRNPSPTFLEDVKKEAVAQLERFKLLSGQYPIHVDGHQHVHIAPGVATVLAGVFATYGVTSVRIPDEDVSEMDWLPDEKRKRYENRYFYAIKARIIYKKHGIVAPECFVGLGLCGTDMTHERMTAALKNTYGMVECMVHPGHPGFMGTATEPFNDPFDTSPDRLHEYTMLNFFVDRILTEWN